MRLKQASERRAQNGNSVPLPSWKAGQHEQAIIDFVTRVTEDGAPEHVSPGERLAVFDNDGALWSAQPMYAQPAVALGRVKELAPQHADWKERQPFKGVLTGDLEVVAASGGAHLRAPPVDMKRDWAAIHPFEKWGHGRVVWLA